VIEHDQPEALCKSGFNQSPQILITPEAMSEHDRRTIFGSGNPHVVPRLQVHAFILPPHHMSTVGCVRWIVDAMNVIGTRPDGWWKDRQRARVRLVEHLERWAAPESRQVVVVFEGPTSSPIHSSVIRIHHAPRATANSADDEIIRIVCADDNPEEINVVTSDATLADRVRTAGAGVCPAARFRDLIDPLI
jgi:predicted RNA-binding protein with PIN domain